MTDLARADAGAALLDDLYDSAIEGASWPAFLRRLAANFHGGTATFRVLDVETLRYRHSTSVGFQATADQRLLTNPDIDSFQAALMRAPAGRMLASQQIADVREFQRSEHYAAVFRPNGNLYAMGGHVERSRGQAVQIGVHRTRQAGPFAADECRQMESLSPHLARAARLMRLLDELEASARQARAALDHLPFGVWLVDRQLRCRWMNRTARGAVECGLHGLRCPQDRLAVTEAAAAAELRAAVAGFGRGEQRLARVKLGLGGACLLLIDAGDGIVHHRLEEAEGLLVFLLDPQRAVAIDREALRDLYGLTPAEMRLVQAFVDGLDLAEACHLLGIRPQTGRTQLKAILGKTDSTRQTELMRRLLLGPEAVRAPNRPPEAGDTAVERKP